MTSYLKLITTMAIIFFITACTFLDVAIRQEKSQSTEVVSNAHEELVELCSVVMNSVNIDTKNSSNEELLSTYEAIQKVDNSVKNCLLDNLCNAKFTRYPVLNIMLKKAAIAKELDRMQARPKAYRSRTIHAVIACNIAVSDEEKHKEMIENFQ